MGAPFITKRFVGVNTSKTDSPEELIGRFADAVSSLADMAQTEGLEPVWDEVKIGPVPEDAALRFFEDPNGTYVTVPMVGRR